MRTSLTALAALVLLAGCGGGPPPDDATSRGLVAKTVLDWHRAQAVVNGVVRQVPPADLRLRWEDGHWLMD